MLDGVGLRRKASCYVANDTRPAPEKAVSKRREVLCSVLQLILIRTEPRNGIHFSNEKLVVYA